MKDYYEFHKAFMFTRFSDAFTGRQLCKWEVWARLSDIGKEIAISTKIINNVSITPLAGTKDGIIIDMKKFKETQNITDDIL